MARHSVQTTLSNDLFPDVRRQLTVHLDAANADQSRLLICFVLTNADINI